MIAFKEFFDVASRTVRSYDHNGFRLVPLEIERRVMRLVGLVQFPDGHLERRIFDIWDEKGVEFVIFFYDNGSVEFFANQEVIQPF